MLPQTAVEQGGRRGWVVHLDLVAVVGLAFGNLANQMRALGCGAAPALVKHSATPARSRRRKTRVCAPGDAVTTELVLHCGCSLAAAHLTTRANRAEL
jgi:hypothetical protein